MHRHFGALYEAGAFMLKTVRQKGLLWPAVMTLAALALLISLGNWQMQRLAWKQGLVAAISERTHASPVGLDEIVWRAKNGGDIEYTRAKASGRLLNDKELFVYAIDAKYGPGYHVITPLQRADGKVVLVNRGYVPLELKDPDKRAESQIGAQVDIVGLVRRPETPNTFTPENNAVDNMWYWRDLDAMTAALDLEPASVMPFYLDAEIEPAASGNWPKGGVTRLELPNRHFEYALTWYGLAAALIAVFAAYAVTRWRRPAP
jgi:surfeit locus 1 family protein